MKMNEKKKEEDNKKGKEKGKKEREKKTMNLRERRKRIKDGKAGRDRERVRGCGEARNVARGQFQTSFNAFLGRHVQGALSACRPTCLWWKHEEVPHLFLGRTL
jgi:hypothetical protein